MDGARARAPRTRGIGDRADEHPLVVAGGHCAYNPEPLADFVDLFVIGDGEEVCGEINAVVAAALDAGEPRDALLRGSAPSRGSTYRPSTSRSTPTADSSP